MRVRLGDGRTGTVVAVWTEDEPRGSLRPRAFGWARVAVDGDNARPAFRVTDLEPEKAAA